MLVYEKEIEIEFEGCSSVKRRIRRYSLLFIIVKNKTKVMVLISDIIESYEEIQLSKFTNIRD